MSARVLMTGATGFLGREVLLRLLARGDHVHVTTRLKPGEGLADADARLRALVRGLDPTVSLERLVVVRADVTEPRLGLGEADVDALLHGDAPVHVLHGAAEVRFDLPREVMERQNVVGTRNVVALARELAARGRLARLDYVSTAFVAGAYVGVAPEAPASDSAPPRNEYERSKRLAEAEVWGSGLPFCIHRPSIIVGDSRTGRAASFKVLYWPLKLYARGYWRLVFGRPGCLVDVVPVDYVADAMLALLDTPEALGRAFHLAAGPARQARIDVLARQAERFFRRRRVRFLDPDFYFRWLRPVLLPLLRLFRPGLAERGRVFLPYLTDNPAFATDAAEALLAPRGLTPPRVEAYFDVIMAYARDTDFGRRPALAPDGGRALVDAGR